MTYIFLDLILLLRSILLKICDKMSLILSIFKLFIYFLNSFRSVVTSNNVHYVVVSFSNELLKFRPSTNRASDFLKKNQTGKHFN